MPSLRLDSCDRRPRRVEHRKGAYSVANFRRRDLSGYVVYSNGLKFKVCFRARFVACSTSFDDLDCVKAGAPLVDHRAQPGRIVRLSREIQLGVVRSDGGLDLGLCGGRRGAGATGRRSRAGPGHGAGLVRIGTPRNEHPRDERPGRPARRPQRRPHTHALGAYGTSDPLRQGDPQAKSPLSEPAEAAPERPATVPSPAPARSAAAPSGGSRTDRKPAAADPAPTGS